MWSRVGCSLATVAALALLNNVFSNEDRTVAMSLKFTSLALVVNSVSSLLASTVDKNHGGEEIYFRLPPNVNNSLFTPY